MNRVLAALSAALWIVAVWWVAAGPVVVGLPGMLTGAAVCATLSTVIRANGLSDRELVELGMLAGAASPRARRSRPRAGDAPAARRDNPTTGPLL